MFTKIKNFIKTEWKFLLFLVLFYFGLTYEFPYLVYIPGGHVDMSERIEGNNTYDETGSLSMTYVSLLKGTLPFLALSKIIPDWDIMPKEIMTYDGVSYEDSIKIDKMYFKEAISNAEYVAYSNAGIDFVEEKIHNSVTYKSPESFSNMECGDEILTIDGKSFSNITELQEYISSKQVGDEVEIKYERDDKTYIERPKLIEIDGSVKVGVSFVSISDYETDFDIDVKTKSSESGPSGGLITALAIYNKITPHDITKDKTIMGTGTISKDGQVGEIGGIKYKLIGAYDDGAEIFICPKENYEEALKVKEERDMDIIIIGVSTFEEALDKLADI